MLKTKKEILKNIHWRTNYDDEKFIIMNSRIVYKYYIKQIIDPLLSFFNICENYSKFMYIIKHKKHNKKFFVGYFNKNNAFSYIIFLEKFMSELYIVFKKCVCIFTNQIDLRDYYDHNGFYINKNDSNEFCVKDRNLIFSENFKKKINPKKYFMDLSIKKLLLIRIDISFNFK